MTSSGAARAAEAVGRRGVRRSLASRRREKRERQNQGLVGSGRPSRALLRTYGAQFMPGVLALHRQSRAAALPRLGKSLANELNKLEGDAVHRCCADALFWYKAHLRAVRPEFVFWKNSFENMKCEIAKPAISVLACFRYARGTHNGLLVSAVDRISDFNSRNMVLPLGCRRQATLRRHACQCPSG
jgi:hypothetical protein